jgi:hypothetical protein
VPSAYEVAPIFLIRLAGVPFDRIARLRTSQTITLAREIGARGGTGKELRSFGTDLSQVLESEVNTTRGTLAEFAREILSDYLVFGSADSANLLSRLSEQPGPRNNRARGREQRLLLYLQRIAAKNDTFSRFGPTAWGRIEAGVQTVKIDIEPGIAARETFLERWTAHAVAAAINDDPEVSQMELLVPALEPHAFEVLYDDVAKWPAGPARGKWLSILQPMAELPKRFATAEQVQDRQSIMDEAHSRLQSLGVARESGDRSLYAATNPIGEECVRKCNFVIGEDLIAQVTTEAEPWIDFWRDSYAFVASRVASGLRRVLEKASPLAAMSLPEFMRTCETAKLPLPGPGLVALADIAFQEVKGAFRERMKPHVDKPEYELTTEDCHFVRNTFQYEKFDEYTYPSADLQIEAESDAIACGDYRWILAELHPPVALLHHCMYWGCPDKPKLNRAFASGTRGRPNFHFGFSAADFTAHTCVRLFDALPELSNFVAPQRARAGWRAVAPSEAEVYVDQTTGDVCLRKIATSEYLGSFARAWIIPLGFHPFQFAMAPHMPRLRCGNVVVQRRAWIVTAEELPKGNYTGLSRELVFAIERLRGQRDLPRYIYVRPTEQALRRSGAEGRDKDTKPVFVDLESYLFLEIFYRWLIKAGELEVTEMLPDPNHLLWKEPDGGHTFELRTLIVPRS